MIGPRTVLCAAVLAALLLPASATARGQEPRLGLIAQDNVLARSAPSSRARVLAVLVQQTQVAILGKRASWTKVKIWASVQAWVPTREIVFRRPWPSVSTYRAPEIHYHVHAHGAQPITAWAMVTAPITAGASGTLRSGSVVKVTAWRQDAVGKVWYQVNGTWIPGGNIQFRTPDPGLQQHQGKPIWQPITGKGMWLTLGTFATGDPNALVRAALRSGIHHLYLEAAISPLGFHGKDSVGHLIEAAHRHHIAVIAWVYPYLYDVASDVALTRQVAAFRTPSGDGFDGIAADLERNISQWDVRAYSQLVRAYLGPNYLLVGVTYPPQAFSTYPFAEVAHSYNAIAPMDYWHQTKTPFGVDYGHMRYGYAYGYRYAADSVAAIRRASGHVPVVPIGQTFDDFGRLEMGPYAPSPTEIAGFLAGSKQSGAVGASFFQWMTAAYGEWRAIQSFRY